MRLTDEQRSFFNRATHSKAIRVTLYDLGIFIGALYFADKVAIMWPQYANAALAGLLGMWAWFIVDRWKNWKSLAYLEEQLNKNEDERDLEAWRDNHE
jgi:hypothetical protein